VKSAFLNDVIQEEVYVREPTGFESLKYSDRVYKFLKILYGLKQAPRAWYTRLKIFLLEHEYVMGSVDKTLFTLNYGTNFLLVQIYVDDIIFCGSFHTIVSRFQKMIESEFHMSMMGELSFFLGIQVKQTKHGIFVHQAKYMKNLMKKFNVAELKLVSTLISSVTSVGSDKDDEIVDQREYRSMTFSSPWGCTRAFSLPHALHIRRQFSEFSGISNTLLSLGFCIPLLLRWILLVFPMLILRVVGLTERALLGLVIFLDLLSFAGLLENSLQLHSPPLRPSI
jgi:hypothetical protein